MHIRSLLLALLTLTTARAELTDEQKKVPLEADTHDPKLAKIVILAGGVNNAPGQHEFFAGSALIMDWLKQNGPVWPVIAADGWPKDERIFDGARSVVVFAEGGPKTPFLEPARMERMRKLMAAGTGFVMLHQSVDIPEEQAPEVEKWIGGVWTKDIGSRGHWDMAFDQFPSHPITRGVKPFFVPFDGWLYNLHFAEHGVVPLFTGVVPDKSRSTPDAKEHNGRAETIGWAYERSDGGRSFAFTGCHMHKNWQLESQRRLVINGILWTAKLEVPESGAKVDLDPAELTKNLDNKPKPAPKPAAAKTATPVPDAPKPAAQ
jgi:hypothetical protein